MFCKPGSRAGESCTLVSLCCQYSCHLMNYQAMLERNYHSPQMEVWYSSECQKYTALNCSLVESEMTVSKLLRYLDQEVDELHLIGWLRPVIFWYSKAFTYATRLLAILESRQERQKSYTPECWKYCKEPKLPTTVPSLQCRCSKV